MGDTEARETDPAIIRVLLRYREEVARASERAAADLRRLGVRDGLPPLPQTPPPRAAIMSIPHVHVGTNAVPSVAAWSARTRPHTVFDVGQTPVQERDYRRRLGKVIVQLREATGMSQAKLAEAVGRSEAALSRWETGKATPSAFDLRRIATAFGMSEEGAYVLIYPPAVYSPEMQRVFESIHGLQR